MLVISQNFTEWFYGQGYDKVAILLDLSCPLLFFMCLGNFVGVQYLSPMGMQNKMTKAYLIAAVLNFSLNMILIPKYLSIGAMIASIVAESASCFIQIYYFLKSEYYISLLKPMSKYILSSVIMGAFLILINRIIPYSGVAKTMLDIIFGVVIYLSCLVVFREEIINSVMIHLLKKGHM